MILHLFEFLTFLSFVFSLATNVYWQLSKGTSFLFFLIFLVLLMIASRLREKSKSWDFILLLGIPLGYVLSMPMVFVVILSLGFILYLRNTFNSHNDQSIAPKIVVGFILLALAAYFLGAMRLVVRFDLDIDNSIYLLLYILSSILFIRTLRHQGTGMDEKRIHKNNIFYVIILALTSSILMFRDQLSFLFKPIRSLATWITMGISFILEKIVRFLVGTDPIPAETIEVIEETTEQTVEATGEGQILSGPIDLSLMTNVVQTFLWIIAILVILFIIYKIFFKVDYFKGEENPGVVERTKLEVPKEKKRKKEKRPTGAYERVAFYYRELMRFIGIDVEAPLTEDVDKLSKSLSLDSTSMSDIYRGTRYKKENATEEEAKNMEALYKKLIKKD